MPVKIRLTRIGKKKQPSYRVVVVDSRKPRDGAHIEQIGRYDPRQDPSVIEIDNERAVAWLQQGAQPSDRARKLLEISGAWARFRVAKGEIHTIDEAPPPAPPPVKAQPAPATAEETEPAGVDAAEMEVPEAATTETVDEHPAEAAAPEFATADEVVTEEAPGEDEAAGVEEEPV